MDSSLTKLLNYVEPQIINIQDERHEEKSLKRVYESLKEIVDTQEKTYLNILEYYDQDFIMRTIKISSDLNMINNYKSSVYLLTNNNPEIKGLPQYKDSLLYMNNLFSYLESFYKKVTVEYEDKKANLEKLELFNKYYILLKKDNIFIDNALEFVNFLNLCDISNIVKLDILVLVNKCNIKNYIRNNDIYITEDIMLSNITNLLDNNKDLIDEKLLINEMLDIDDLIIKNDINNLNKQKKYIINKINKLYLDNNYEEIINYYLDYQKISKYLEKELNKEEVENLLV